MVSSSKSSLQARVASWALEHKYRPVAQQMFFFGIIGVLATLADLATYIALTRLAQAHYLIAATCGLLVGALISFSLNKYLNFKNKYASVHRQFVVFTLIAVISFFITLGLLYVFVEKLGIHDILSKIIVAVIVFIWNFTAHKAITFTLMK